MTLLADVAQGMHLLNCTKRVVSSDEWRPSEIMVEIMTGAIDDNEAEMLLVRQLQRRKEDFDALLGRDQSQEAT